MGHRPLGGLALEYVTGRIARGEITPGTGRNHRCYLSLFAEAMGNRPVGRIGVSDIERWMESRSHLRVATRRSQFSVVRSFCAWLVDRHLMRTNPFDKLRSPKLPRSIPRALPEQNVERLLAACPDERARLIVWLMVGLGCRCCEVANLEVGDWDRRAGIVRVVGKGGHERELPTTAEVEAALSSYLTVHPATSGALVRSYRDDVQPLQANTISGMVSEWMRAAGIKAIARDGVSAHALRHTAASDVAERCGDLRVVQEMLGHRHLATTSIYLRRAGMASMRTAMQGRTYRTAG